nr:unnamed protein product [Digitaria exilis]
MAPKTKQPNVQGATMGSAPAGSYSSSRGVSGLSPQEVSPGDCRKKRCSYNEDKHCMASKLMQQVSDDYPPMYKVTYMYKHTCNAAPIPAPDVVAEAELPAGMLLRFGPYGSDHRNNAGRMHQEQREYNQPMSWSPFELLGFDSSNSQLQQQPVLSFGVTPSTAGSSSSSFPIVESTPMLPATNDDSSEGDVLSTWSSFSYGVDEGHLHSENHADFAGNTGPASRG